MMLEVREHSAAAWETFSKEAQFVPDPMILRAGEVFANGATGAKALGKPSMEVKTALRDNIAGLIEFFDLVAAYDRVPLINYEYTFDMDSVPTPIGALLGQKALPVTIGYDAYEKIKAGALKSLATFDKKRIKQFAVDLNELESLRYDWRPSLKDPPTKGWPAKTKLDERTQLVAHFLLGGLIFSGFAQASGTDHIIQPKRSRFFLALTAAPPVAGVTRAVEDYVFDTAAKALEGTDAETRRLDALPPVLPYLLSKVRDNVTAGDLLKRALDFANTKDGDKFRKAVKLIRGDGVGAAQTEDLSKAAKAEALALLKSYSALADLANTEGGLKVKANLGLNPSFSVEKTLPPPAWLKLWWNEQVWFGGLRKVFRRMWMEAESFRNLEEKLLGAWARS